jgi:hypothetical protein
MVNQQQMEQQLNKLTAYLKQKKEEQQKDASMDIAGNYKTLVTNKSTTDGTVITLDGIEDGSVRDVLSLARIISLYTGTPHFGNSQKVLMTNDNNKTSQSISIENGSWFGALVQPNLKASVGTAGDKTITFTVKPVQ